MHRLLVLLLPALVIGGILLVGRPAAPQSGSLVDYRPDETTIEQCGPNLLCLRQAYANLVFREGARPALARLEAAMRADREILVHCHQISHWMGAAGLLRAEGGLAAAFVEGDDTCGAGYWHGLMQSRIGGLFADSEQSLADSIDVLCSEPSIRQNGWIYWQCIHGLGHGLMIARDYDLPSALSDCERLSRPSDIDVCTNGVFMENVIPSMPGAPRTWVSDEDPEVPCNRVASRHAAACYQYAADQALKVSGTLEAAATLCLSFTPEWIDLCLDGLGRSVGANSAYRPAEIVRICAGAGARSEVCVTGAAVDSVQNEPDQMARSAAICASLASDALTRCWWALGSMIGTATNAGEDPAARCGAAPDDRTRTACTEAARSSYAAD